MTTVPLMAVTYYHVYKANSLQQQSFLMHNTNPPWFQEVVQSLRPKINLMAVQLSCDGLELQCAPSPPWKVFRVNMSKRSQKGTYGQALVLGTVLSERW